MLKSILTFQILLFSIVTFGQNTSNLFINKSKLNTKSLNSRTTNRQFDLILNSKKADFKNFVDNYKTIEFKEEIKDSTATDTLVLDPKSPTFKLDSIKKKEVELKLIAERKIKLVELATKNAKIQLTKEMHQKAETLYNEKNYIEAFIILNQIAQNKDAFAEYSLGFMFDNEQGVAKNKENAIKWYTLAANQNVVAAQNELGTVFEEYFIANFNSKNNIKNLEKALFWYKKAANQNDAVALKNLVRCYSLFYDLDPNYTKNLVEIIKNYEQYLTISGTKEPLYAENEFEAQVQLIKIYLGNNDVKNTTKGLQLFEKIAQKNGEASFQLGNILINEKISFFNRNEGLKWLKNAEELGNFDAMYVLSQIYKNGSTEIPKDKIKSDGYLNKFFENIIKDKNITEKKPELIAKVYRDGIGTNRDFDEASNWYKKSINFPIASDNLALIQANGGFGIIKNPAECSKWQKKSIDFLIENSAETLKLVVSDSLLEEGGAKTIIENGKNAPPLFSEFKPIAFYIENNNYLQIEDYDFIDNYNSIGIRFESGIGTKSNNFEAINWYEKSFEKTFNTYSPVNLVRLYSKAKDNEKTAYWLKTLTDLLHDENNISTLSSNQYNTIGILFEAGKDGFSKNIEEAKFCYSKAVALGSKEAEIALAKLTK